MKRGTMFTMFVFIFITLLMILGVALLFVVIDNKILMTKIVGILCIILALIYLKSIIEYSKKTSKK